ncbi:hypothetical protein ABZP36_015743 [Zizania latifolia]
MFGLEKRRRWGQRKIGPPTWTRSRKPIDSMGYGPSDYLRHSRAKRDSKSLTQAASAMAVTALYSRRAGGEEKLLEASQAACVALLEGSDVCCLVQCAATTSHDGPKK